MNDGTDIADSLPALERQVFVAVRGSGRVTVNDVAARLPSSRPLAYTTVMTVLSRLWRKGYLRRHEESRAYVYEAPSDAEIANELGGRAARQALDRFGPPALTGFVNSLSSEQRALVVQLLHDGNDAGEDRQ